MDHVVYLDAKAHELENLLNGKKSMLVRGAAGRKMPYGRVNPADVLYLLNNDGEGLIRAQATVKSVFNSEAMTPEQAQKLVESYQAGLQLTPAQVKRWGCKRYLVIIEVEQVQAVEPFGVDKSGYGNMDDWLPVGDINSVRL